MVSLPVPLWDVSKVVSDFKAETIVFHSQSETVAFYCHEKK